MFARVSTYDGSPDKVEEGIQTVHEIFIQQEPGFKGAYFLVDRKSGRAMTITLWESEEAVRDTTGVANPLRSRIAQSLGVTQEPMVEIYEVAEVVAEPARKAA